MALINAERVRETSITTGTGDLALAGAPDSTYQTVSAVAADGDCGWFLIRLGAAWERSFCRYNSGAGTLSRLVVLESTNADALVNFGAGAKDIINDFPAKLASVIAGRNILHNPGFTINQRAYVSAAALASGTYGHDRWKAGASGGDYSFTQLAGPTQITIASGKSLIQVIEDKNVVGGSYVLSWTGTAVARVGVDSATPSGNFAASPILITSQTAGTTMSIEFTGANAVGGSFLASNSGTLGQVQLELGSLATPFEFRQYGIELSLCMRYFQRIVGDTTNFPFVIQNYLASATNIDTNFTFSVPMKAAPSSTVTGTFNNTNTSNPNVAYTSPNGWVLRCGAAAAGMIVSYMDAASTYISFSADI